MFTYIWRWFGKVGKVSAGLYIDTDNYFQIVNGSQLTEMPAHRDKYQIYEVIDLIKIYYLYFENFYIK